MTSLKIGILLSRKKRIVAILFTLLFVNVLFYHNYALEDHLTLVVQLPGLLGGQHDLPASSRSSRSSPSGDRHKLQGRRLNFGPSLDARQLAAELSISSAEWMDQPVINHFSFGFVHHQKAACFNKSVDVVIACPVSRSRAGFAKRQAVRDTWGSYARDPANRAVLLFFLGSDLNLDEDSISSGNQRSTRAPVAKVIQKRIDQESELHGDIVQTDFSDTYRNLSLKSISILRWVDLYCPQTDYVIKADDDVYVVVPTLVNKLKFVKTQIGKKIFIIGSKVIGVGPITIKRSKWYTPLEDFPELIYPNYTNGPSYAMTGPTSRLLFQAALRTPLFWLEDVYITGLCARKANVTIVDDVTMTSRKLPATGCAFRDFTTGHQYFISQIRKIHRQLRIISIKNNTSTCS